MEPESRVADDSGEQLATNGTDSPVENMSSLPGDPGGDLNNDLLETSLPGEQRKEELSGDSVMENPRYQPAYCADNLTDNPSNATSDAQASVDICSTAENKPSYMSNEQTNEQYPVSDIATSEPKKVEGVTNPGIASHLMLDLTATDSDRGRLASDLTDSKETVDHDSTTNTLFKNDEVVDAEVPNSPAPVRFSSVASENNESGVFADGIGRIDTMIAKTHKEKSVALEVPPLAEGVANPPDTVTIPTSVSNEATFFSKGAKISKETDDKEKAHQSLHLSSEEQLEESQVESPGREEVSLRKEVVEVAITRYGSVEGFPYVESETSCDENASGKSGSQSPPKEVASASESYVERQSPGSIEAETSGSQLMNKEPERLEATLRLDSSPGLKSDLTCVVAREQVLPNIQEIASGGIDTKDELIGPTSEVHPALIENDGNEKRTKKTIASEAWKEARSSKEADKIGVSDGYTGVCTPASTTEYGEESCGVRSHELRPEDTAEGYPGKLLEIADKDASKQVAAHMTEGESEVATGSSSMHGNNNTVAGEPALETEITIDTNIMEALPTNSSTGVVTPDIVSNAARFEIDETAEPLDVVVKTAVDSRDATAFDTSDVDNVDMNPVADLGVGTYEIDIDYAVTDDQTASETMNRLSEEESGMEPKSEMKVEELLEETGVGICDLQQKVIQSEVEVDGSESSSPIQGAEKNPVAVPGNTESLGQDVIDSFNRKARFLPDSQDNQVRVIDTAPEGKEECSTHGGEITLEFSGTEDMAVTSHVASADYATENASGFHEASTAVERSDDNSTLHDVDSVTANPLTFNAVLFTQHYPEAHAIEAELDEEGVLQVKTNALHGTSSPPTMLAGDASTVSESRAVQDGDGFTSIYSEAHLTGNAERALPSSDANNASVVEAPQPQVVGTQVLSSVGEEHISCSSDVTSVQTSANAKLVDNPQHEKQAGSTISQSDEILDAISRTKNLEVDEPRDFQHEFNIVTSKANENLKEGFLATQLTEPSEMETTQTRFSEEDRVHLSSTIGDGVVGDTQGHSWTHHRETSNEAELSTREFCSDDTSSSIGEVSDEKALLTFADPSSEGIDVANETTKVTRNGAHDEDNESLVEATAMGALVAHHNQKAEKIESEVGDNITASHQEDLIQEKFTGTRPPALSNEGQKGNDPKEFDKDNVDFHRFRTSAEVLASPEDPNMKAVTKTVITDSDSVGNIESRNGDKAREERDEGVVLSEESSPLMRDMRVEPMEGGRASEGTEHADETSLGSPGNTIRNRDGLTDETNPEAHVSNVALSHQSKCEQPLVVGSLVEENIEVITSNDHPTQSAEVCLIGASLLREENAGNNLQTKGIVMPGHKADQPESSVRNEETLPELARNMRLTESHTDEVSTLHVIDSLPGNESYPVGEIHSEMLLVGPAIVENSSLEESCISLLADKSEKAYSSTTATDLHNILERSCENTSREFEKVKSTETDVLSQFDEHSSLEAQGGHPSTDRADHLQVSTAGFIELCKVVEPSHENGSEVIDDTMREAPDTSEYSNNTVLKKSADQIIKSEVVQKAMQNDDDVLQFALDTQQELKTEVQKELEAIQNYESQHPVEDHFPIEEVHSITCNSEKEAGVKDFDDGLMEDISDSHKAIGTNAAPTPEAVLQKISPMEIDITSRDGAGSNEIEQTDRSNEEESCGTSDMHQSEDPLNSKLSESLTHPDAATAIYVNSEAEVEPHQRGGADAVQVHISELSEAPEFNKEEGIRGNAVTTHGGIARDEAIDFVDRILPDATVADSIAASPIPIHRTVYSALNTDTEISSPNEDNAMPLKVDGHVTEDEQEIFTKAIVIEQVEEVSTSEDRTTASAYKHKQGPSALEDVTKPHTDYESNIPSSLEENHQETAAHTHVEVEAVGNTSALPDFVDEICISLLDSEGPGERPAGAGGPETEASREEQDENLSTADVVVKLVNDGIAQNDEDYPEGGITERSPDVLQEQCTGCEDAEVVGVELTVLASENRTLQRAEGYVTSQFAENAPSDIAIRGSTSEDDSTMEAISAELEPKLKTIGLLNEETTIETLATVFPEPVLQAPEEAVETEHEGSDGSEQILSSSTIREAVEITNEVNVAPKDENVLSSEVEYLDADTLSAPTIGTVTEFKSIPEAEKAEYQQSQTNTTSNMGQCTNDSVTITPLFGHKQKDDEGNPTENLHLESSGTAEYYDNESWSKPADSQERLATTESPLETQSRVQPDKMVPDIEQESISKASSNPLIPALESEQTVEEGKSFESPPLCTSKAPHSDEVVTGSRAPDISYQAMLKHTDAAESENLATGRKEDEDGDQRAKARDELVTEKTKNADLIKRAEVIAQEASFVPCHDEYSISENLAALVPSETRGEEIVPESECLLPDEAVLSPEDLDFVDETLKGEAVGVSQTTEEKKVSRTSTSGDAPDNSTVQETACKAPESATASWSEEHEGVPATPTNPSTTIHSRTKPIIESILNENTSCAREVVKTQPVATTQSPKQHSQVEAESQIKESVQHVQEDLNLAATDVLISETEKMNETAMGNQMEAVEEAIESHDDEVNREGIPIIAPLLTENTDGEQETATHALKFDNDQVSLRNQASSTLLVSKMTNAEAAEGIKSETQHKGLPSHEDPIPSKDYMTNIAGFAEEVNEGNIGTEPLAKHATSRDKMDNHEESVTVHMDVLTGLDQDEPERELVVETFAKRREKVQNTTIPNLNSEELSEMKVELQEDRNGLPSNIQAGEKTSQSSMIAARVTDALSGHIESQPSKVKMTQQCEEPPREGSGKKTTNPIDTCNETTTEIAREDCDEDNMLPDKEHVHRAAAVSLTLRSTRSESRTEETEPPFESTVPPGETPLNSCDSTRTTCADTTAEGSSTLGEGSLAVLQNEETLEMVSTAVPSQLQNQIAEENELMAQRTVETELEVELTAPLVLQTGDNKERKEDSIEPAEDSSASQCGEDMPQTNILALGAEGSDSSSNSVRILTHGEVVNEGTSTTRLAQASHTEHKPENRTGEEIDHFKLPQVEAKVNTGTSSGVQERERAKVALRDSSQDLNDEETLPSTYKAASIEESCAPPEALKEHTRAQEQQSNSLDGDNNIHHAASRALVGTKVADDETLPRQNNSPTSTASRSNTIAKELASTNDNTFGSVQETEASADVILSSDYHDEGAAGKKEEPVRQDVVIREVEKQLEPVITEEEQEIVNRAEAKDSGRNGVHEKNERANVQGANFDEDGAQAAIAVPILDETRDTTHINMPVPDGGTPMTIAGESSENSAGKEEKQDRDVQTEGRTTRAGSVVGKVETVETAAEKAVGSSLPDAEDLVTEDPAVVSSAVQGDEAEVSEGSAGGISAKTASRGLDDASGSSPERPRFFRRRMAAATTFFGMVFFQVAKVRLVQLSHPARGDLISVIEEELGLVAARHTSGLAIFPFAAFMLSDKARRPSLICSVMLTCAFLHHFFVLSWFLVRGGAKIAEQMLANSCERGELAGRIIARGMVWCVLGLPLSLILSCERTFGGALERGDRRMPVASRIATCLLASLFVSLYSDHVSDVLQWGIGDIGDILYPTYSIMLIVGCTLREIFEVCFY